MNQQTEGRSAADTERALCAELQVYCEAQGLPLVSADELAFVVDLSDAQHEWVNDFCHRWEVRHDKAGVALGPLELEKTSFGTFTFTHEGVSIHYPASDSSGRFACSPAEYGFAVVTTGGNCSAWRREVTVEGVAGEMLITAADESTHEFEPLAPVTVGVYWPAGEAFRHQVLWVQEFGTIEETPPRDVSTYTEGIGAGDGGASSQPSVAALAREFARVVCDYLGAEVMGAVRAKNATTDYAGCCATHDYCDANMLMLQAWETLTGRKVQDEDGFEELHSCASLFNAAWGRARAARFEVDKLPA